MEAHKKEQQAPGDSALGCRGEIAPERAIFVFVDADEYTTSTWIAIGRGLTAISVLSIAAGTVVVFGNSGISARDRIFEASESVDAVTGLFALAAVVVLLLTRTPPEKSRGVLVVAQSVGAVMIACAAYAAWYALTTHSHLPLHFTSFVVFVGLNWWYRTSGLFAAGTTAVMGAILILAARRARRPTPPAATPRLGEGLSDHA